MKSRDELLDVCCRLSDRLEDRELNTLQVRNLATILVLVQRLLQQAFADQGYTDGEPARMCTLELALRPLHNRLGNPSTAELRAHVAAAVDAAMASVQLLEVGAPTKEANYGRIHRPLRVYRV